jgi:hypothetical protein
MNKRFVCGEFAMTRLVDRWARGFKKVSLNGFLFHPQVSGNLSKTVSLLMENPHAFIPSHSSLLRCLLSSIIPFEGEIFAQDHFLNGSQKLMDLREATANGLVNGIMKVLAEVKTVSDLNGLRSPKASGFCILSSSVATHDLNGGITCEPGCGR